MKFNTKNLLSPDIKIISIPIISIIVVIIISFLMIKPTYAKIQKSINDFKDSTTKEKILGDKLKSLKVVDTNILDKTDISFLALPNKNPSAWMLAQLKNGMIQGNITMKEVKLVSEKDKDLNKVVVTFNIVIPELSSFVNFLNYLDKITPLTLIDSYIVSSEGEEIEVAMNMSIYYADLPSVLPPITEPFEGLSQKQEAVLDYVSKLNRPQFDTLEPVPPTERIIPFN
ncbi:hypothetical protein A2159_01760 [Candidatus Woesebacteria bacterium RBG_13_34_9]|uniref:Uncharacterized protein n=1 Tax=Candidatus Woesebacteria bacterium RBG_13_34_9 TaxID=1802477 RepID=A0A1F7X4B6_9BACT|nr:MAG: hypothetical protein A2159_01760 [Candidatus Woesebacteria bacterium RBG_13_34_9]